MEDVCDGALFKNHRLFTNDPSALQIIAFFDELELCNPLGTHVSYIAIMLFTLGNIDPRYRSSLKLIRLLIAATVPIVERHGIDEVLQPFVLDLAEEGVNVSTNSEIKTFRGGLLLCLGDNLGSNTLGGFKQSFSFSLRFCRTCYVTQDAYKSLSNPSQLELRSDDKHLHECSQIAGPLHDHYSRIYGINRRSALLDIPFFSMFNGGLAHDIMHGILEGVASLEMLLVLRHCILSKRYITLDEYNYRLINFDFNYMETNKPPSIDSRSVLADGKSLRISASQSLLLLRIFPLLIGDVIPIDDKTGNASCYWPKLLILLCVRGRWQIFVQF